MYTCTYGYREVRQTSKSYGSWNNWYNDSKDGKLTIRVKIDNNGKVTISGEASGYAYITWSVLSSGVRQSSISASFDIEVTSKRMPQVLYDENNKTIKYNGNASFTFSYLVLKTNEDIDFNYKNASTYKFSK